MLDDNISSTGYSTLSSHAPFISFDFRLAVSCFLRGNNLIHPQLPQCKLQYCCDFLQLRELAFKMGAFCSNSIYQVQVFIMDVLIISIIELCECISIIDTTQSRQTLKARASMGSDMLHMIRNCIQSPQVSEKVRYE